MLQHVVAHGGQTYPPLFRAAMTSSTFLPAQYHYNDPIPTVCHHDHYLTQITDMFVVLQALYNDFASGAGSVIILAM